MFPTIFDYVYRHSPLLNTQWTVQQKNVEVESTVDKALLLNPENIILLENYTSESLANDIMNIVDALELNDKK